MTMQAAVFLLIRRVRLLALLAGVAWLLGIYPPTVIRLILVVAVAVALVLDVLADRAPIRTTTLGRPGGDQG